MRKGHVVCDAVPAILIDPWDVHQETRGHTDECLPRPCVEPVKDGAVDQGRELSSPDAEFVAHGTEAQNHMQEPPDLVDEEVPAVLGCVNQARGLHLVPHCIAEVVLVLLYIVTCEQLSQLR